MRKKNRWQERDIKIKSELRTDREQTEILARARRAKGQSHQGHERGDTTSTSATWHTDSDEIRENEVVRFCDE